MVTGHEVDGREETRINSYFLGKWLIEKANSKKELQCPKLKSTIIYCRAQVQSILPVVFIKFS